MINRNSVNYNRIESINRLYLQRKRKVDKISKCKNIKDFIDIEYEKELFNKCISSIELTENEILYLTYLDIDSKNSSLNAIKIRSWLEKESKRINSNNYNKGENK